MFLSHKSSISSNSFLVLDQYDKKKVLINHHEYKLVSNICPHQNSLISEKNGSGNRVCPYHNWSFDLDGIPITSGRTERYCKNTVPLDSQPVFEWNSLLFDTPVNYDISVDFSNMQLVEQRVDTVNSNYKNIMDLFLDVDHIQSVHAGVYDLVDITNTDVTWKYYSNGSIQQVDQGAFWIAVYPYTMVEWQKGSMFITVAKPYGDKSTVHVFKYHDNNSSTSWKLNEFVWETAWSQDKHQAELINKFSDRNLENQKIHFREFLKSNGFN
jgi:phenylpropionate dioxygenase-like ring-hydroxylating dioxygenase large terminal subunit